MTAAALLFDRDQDGGGRRGAPDLSRTSAQRLLDGDARPYFGDFDEYLHVTAVVPSPRRKA